MSSILKLRTACSPHLTAKCAALFSPISLAAGAFHLGYMDFCAGQDHCELHSAARFRTVHRITRERQKFTMPAKYHVLQAKQRHQCFSKFRDRNKPLLRPPRTSQAQAWALILRSNDEIPKLTDSACRNRSATQGPLREPATQTQICESGLLDVWCFAVR